MKSLTSRAAHVAMFLAVTALPAVAQAQAAEDPSNTQGLFLNARAGGYGVAYEGAREGTGGGIGLRAGYGFSDLFTAYLGVEGAAVTEGDGFEGLPTGDNYHMVFVDLGVRFHFRRESRWSPFAEVATSVVGLGFDNVDGDPTTFAGLSGSVGGGVLYFASPSLALEGSASFAAGGLMEREIAGAATDVDIGVTGIRLHFGVAYYPFD